ncbi:hypothetical protein GCM10009795_011370 [Nocardioides hankookensis]|uniref:Transmembrane protein n=1 Tax=Nocardioides hankookensis TaxID=443157 RepID=A0ABW1LIA6_9ACTN
MSGFRPASLTAYAVGAVMWGVLAIAIGADRLYNEWHNYRVLHDFMDGRSGTVVLGSSVVATPTLFVLVELAWVVVTVAWLTAAVVHRFAGDRHPRAGRQLAAACASVTVAVVGLVVMFRDEPWGSNPFEPHLVTPTFLAALVLVVVGVAALALAWWSLRTDQSQEAPGSQPVQANS